MTRVAEAARAVAWLLMCAFVVGGLVLLIVGATGCGASQRDALAAMTEIASARMPDLAERAQAEVDACLAGPREQASACINESERGMAPALAGARVLLAVDDAALGGSVDWGNARAAYCALRVALPDMPGAVLGIEVCL